MATKAQVKVIALSTVVTCSNDKAVATITFVSKISYTNAIKTSVIIHHPCLFSNIVWLMITFVLFEVAIYFALNFALVINCTL